MDHQRALCVVREDKCCLLLLLHQQPWERRKPASNDTYILRARHRVGSTRPILRHSSREPLQRAAVTGKCFTASGHIGFGVLSALLAIERILSPNFRQPIASRLSPQFDQCRCANGWLFVYITLFGVRLCTLKKYHVRTSCYLVSVFFATFVLAFDTLELLMFACVTRLCGMRIISRRRTDYPLVCVGYYTLDNMSVATVLIVVSLSAPPEPSPLDSVRRTDLSSWTVSLCALVMEALSWRPKTSGAAVNGKLYIGWRAWNGDKGFI